MLEHAREMEVNTLEGSRKRWEVGFFVRVEVVAHNGEAATLASCATQWPVTRSGDPIHVQGFINGKLVGADVTDAIALTVKELPL